MTNKINTYLLTTFLISSGITFSSESVEEKPMRPLQREERISNHSSKEELDKETQEYFKRVPFPIIPMVKSYSNLNEDDSQ